ncbi:MAG: hypothetical protein OEV49_08330 [candidate division Zixibacteria bacterium]|nr:hypothetical protein [candidate division Zixibacteria bacterium]MDH3937394.1 hypothetical protein [candidate division Zixibacteria bacterium]MDH4033394.1 hypothetical protein [candidate division Zixibacteria bacterium]
MLRVAFLAGLVLLLSQGCNEWDQFNPIGAQHGNTPRAEGMWLTDDEGFIIGTWGKPTDSIIAYPNPSLPPIDIAYHVPKEAPVTLWLVRALGPLETEEEMVVWGGAEVTSASGAPIAVLVQTIQFPGRYVITWGGTDVPDGFYRIWLAIGADITYTDIYLGKDPARYSP